MAQPTYIAFCVRDAGEGDDAKSFWTRIGAAFENKDKSLSVVLDALPVNGKIVLQVPKEKPDSPPSE